MIAEYDARISVSPLQASMISRQSYSITTLEHPISWANWRPHCRTRASVEVASWTCTIFFATPPQLDLLNRGRSLPSHPNRPQEGSISINFVHANRRFRPSHNLHRVPGDLSSISCCYHMYWKRWTWGGGWCWLLSSLLIAPTICTRLRRTLSPEGPVVWARGTSTSAIVVFLLTPPNPNDQQPAPDW